MTLRPFDVPLPRFEDLNYARSYILGDDIRVVFCRCLKFMGGKLYAITAAINLFCADGVATCKYDGIC